MIHNLLDLKHITVYSSLQNYQKPNKIRNQQFVKYFMLLISCMIVQHTLYSYQLSDVMFGHTTESSCSQLYDYLDKPMHNCSYQHMNNFRFDILQLDSESIVALLRFLKALSYQDYDTRAVGNKYLVINYTHCPGKPWPH